ncbi:MAG: LysR family transcriptional regulator [Alphaproteobacteria bacterium]|nr:LysR family transcriptional regulator [Alphaproteobacteria bacterium]
MDRLDAMEVFVAAVDEGSLAAAGRRLGRSPAAVTRAVALLERRTGTRLLNRTTRTLRLTAAGERYAATCRRLIADLAEAELAAGSERQAPRGLLTLTAPSFFGALHVRPLTDAFLDAYPEVQVRLLLLDRVINLIDEGMDLAVRIGQLPDSNLIAVGVGALRRVVCASPDYLARRPAPATPSDLAQHDCIAFTQESPVETSWSFAAGPERGATRPTQARHVRVRPRFITNSAEAAVAAASAGHGITRVLSYQVERELAAGRLVLLLPEFEPPPPPVHLVYPEARLALAKARAFVDFAVPRLRAELARIASVADNA